MLKPRDMLLRRLAPMLFLLPMASLAQAPPIPDVPTLLQQVMAHQRQMDAVRENYTYREIQIVQTLDKNGNVKKTETDEYNVFFVNTHEVDRLVKKNGQELSAGEQNKEQARVMKAIEQAQKTPPGQVPDRDTVSVSRLLSILKVSSPRRITMDGRSTLVFDFVGDPHARTHGRAEDASKKIAGTLWIDEQDREVRRMEAHFYDNFHMGFGLLSVAKGSTFLFEQKPIRGQLWLPSNTDIHLVAHAIGILGFRANIRIADDGYQQFHVGAEQQPGAQVVASHPK
jgi:hypothetical protein